MTAPAPPPGAYAPPLTAEKIVPGVIISDHPLSPESAWPFHLLRCRPGVSFLGPRIEALIGEWFRQLSQTSCFTQGGVRVVFDDCPYCAEYR